MRCRCSKKEDAKNSHPLFFMSDRSGVPLLCKEGWRGGRNIEWEQWIPSCNLSTCEKVKACDLSMNRKSGHGKSPEILQEILHRCRGSGTVSPSLDNAGVAEQADARDLKSLGLTSPSRFKSGLRHQAYRLFSPCQIPSSLQPS